MAGRATLCDRCACPFRLAMLVADMPSYRCGVSFKRKMEKVQKIPGKNMRRSRSDRSLPCGHDTRKDERPGAPSTSAPQGFQYPQPSCAQSTSALLEQTALFSVPYSNGAPEGTSCPIMRHNDVTHPYEGVLPNGGLMSAGQLLWDRNARTYIDSPGVVLVEPPSRPTSPSLFDLPFPLSSSYGSGSSCGSPVPSSPYSTGGSFCGSSLSPSPAPSSPELARSVDRNRFIPDFVTSGMVNMDFVAGSSTNDIASVTPLSEPLSAETFPVEWLHLQRDLSTHSIDPRFTHDPVDRSGDIRRRSVDTGHMFSSSQHTVAHSPAGDANDQGLQGIHIDWSTGGSQHGATHSGEFHSNPRYPTLPHTIDHPHLQSAPSEGYLGMTGPSAVHHGIHIAYGEEGWDRDGVGPSSNEAVERAGKDGSNIFKRKVASVKSKVYSTGRRKAQAKYTCPISDCDDTFTKRHNLLSKHQDPAVERKASAHLSAPGHVRAHNNERPFGCRWCVKTFVRANDRKRHEDLYCKESQSSAGADGDDVATMVRTRAALYSGATRGEHSL